MSVEYVLLMFSELFLAMFVREINPHRWHVTNYTLITQSLFLTPFNGRWPESMTQFPSCRGVLHTQRISICRLLSTTSDTISHCTSMRRMGSFRHWSFWSQASSPSPDQPPKGLEDHVHSITHRVLFVQRKWCNRPSSFSGLGTRRVTSSMWQRVLSSSPWQRWCHPEAHDFWKRRFPAYVHAVYVYQYILCRNTRLKKQGNEDMKESLSVSCICLWAFLVQAFNSAKRKHRSSARASHTAAWTAQ